MEINQLLAGPESWYKWTSILILQLQGERKVLAE
jgi:hypothetical protein